jgi:hypothetical protein
LLAVNDAMGPGLTGVKIKDMQETNSSRLEALKQLRFHPETQAKRIAAALAALQSPSALRLSADEWKDAAENPVLEEEQ